MKVRDDMESVRRSTREKKRERMGKEKSAKVVSKENCRRRWFGSLWYYEYSFITELIM